MSFPINTTIPAAGNNPSLDQQPMQQNFANINSYLGVDHTTPGTNPGDGQHNQVTFHINQAAPSIANGVSGLFANLSSSLSQLFFQNSSGAVQMTGLPTNASGTNFGITTPWGLKINWGQQANVSSGGQTITFRVPFSNTNYAVVLTPVNTGASSVSVGNGFGTNSITAYSTQLNTVFYLAIGT